jgi:hypothetical protein
MTFTTSRPRTTLPAESPSLPDSVTPYCVASSLPRDVVFPFQRVAATREGAGAPFLPSVGSLVSFDAGSHLVGSAERHAGPRHPLLRGLPGVVGLRGAAGAWCRLLTGMIGALASLFGGRRESVEPGMVRVGQVECWTPRGITLAGEPTGCDSWMSPAPWAFVFRCGVCRSRVETSEALLESAGLCIACFYRPEVAA